MKRDKMSNNTTTINSSVVTRVKGLLWAFGAIALVFTLISLAPVISHMG
jgi:hypothetical protein